jgi:hypothetical protein
MRYAPFLTKAFFALLMLVSVTPFVQAQDAGWVEYDFSQGAYSKKCGVALKNSAMDNLERIRNASTNEPAVIAHRGVYSKSLPGTEGGLYAKGLFAAENTILAFQHAQCLGYPGVEVDLKYTDAVGPEKDEAGQRTYDLSPKSELILAHDENLMRFTNFGCEDSFFNLTFSSQIVVHEELGTRVVRPPSITCPRIRNMEASEIKSKLKYMQTYNEMGHVVYHPGYDSISKNYINNSGDADGKSLFLRYALEKAKYDDTLNRLIWVLDIQNYPTLELALQVVKDLNMWDRVIFKIWIEALPLKPNPDGEPPILDLSSHPYANYVFAINGLNTKLINDSLMSNVWQKGDIMGREVNLPTIGILNLIRDFSKLHSNHFLGFEFLINNGQTQTDKAIAHLQILVNRHWLNPGKTWGVLRVADYICNGNSSLRPCQLSGGRNLYATAPTRGDNSWVRLYTEKQLTIDVRWAHGRKSAVQTKDIRRRFTIPNASLSAIQSQLR